MRLILVSCAALATLAGSREAIPPQSTTNPMPSVLLKNAAKPNTRYPLIGLGLLGSGYKIGQVQECWHYPTCCTKEYCPAINATRQWLQMGGWRLDTGYPYGDIDLLDAPYGDYGQTCGGWHSTSKQKLRGRRLAHACDAEGTKIALQQSMQNGLNREDVFITVKSGFAGPMSYIDRGYTPFDHGQADYQLNWLGIDFADLYLMHEGDLGHDGNWPNPFVCPYPITSSCRLKVWNSCLRWMDNNFTRACGVANWELAWLEELVAAKTTLPAVVQMKFHPHQSFASPRIAAIKAFCDAHKIVFNGYSPLGRADWTTFLPAVGMPTLLKEPVVATIAQRVNKTVAQVLLRWQAQQGIPTQPRTLNPQHMQENLDVFNWTLMASEMAALGSMPQCSGTRGNPFMDGDPEGEPAMDDYVNMIGPMLHC